MFKKIMFITVAVAMAGIAACVSTKQGKNSDLETSGFLGDYSMLEKGGEGEAILKYRKPGHDFSQYEKVLIKPVSIWSTGDFDHNDISEEQKQEFADTFFTLMYKEFSKSFPITRRMGSKTLVIEVALTNAEKSNATMDTVSTIIPVGLLIASTQEMMGARGIVTGAARAEIKVTDGKTGEIVAAAVDERWGSKNLKDSHEEWGDVKHAMEVWSQQLAHKVCIRVYNDWDLCETKED